MWRMIGRQLDTADLAGVPSVTQRFRHPSRALVLRGVQIGVILCNDPTFDDLSAKIYADRAGSPGKLIATSSTLWSKAQVLTQYQNGVKFCGFTFPDVNLQAGTWYHLALVPTAYVGDNDSHVAWRTSYPDPQYSLNLELNAAKAANHHLEFSIIGAFVGNES